MIQDETRRYKTRRDKTRQDKRRCDESDARSTMVEENEISAYLVHCLCEHSLFNIKHIYKPNKKKEYVHGPKRK